MRWASVLSLIALLLPVGQANAQVTGTISGLVTDGSLRPLAGVQMTIEGTNRGALTNAEGRYILAGAPVGAQTVRASVIGYAEGTAAVTVVAGEAAIANFTLSVSAIQLEGVVAVGYGTQQRVNVTGAVAAVNAEEMARLPVPTVTQALQGMAPGLQILDGGQQPGRNNVDVLIRGQGTLGRGNNQGSAAAARPLVLIDGIEGDLSTVDVNDVENVSVLKDASSAAIYGSRAANGVILVTTKRGLATEGVQIQYSGYVGMQDITAWPENVGAPTHMELRNVARTNLRNWCTTTGSCDPTAYPNTYTQGQIDSTRAGIDPVHYPNTNWVDAQFDPAPIQDHSLRISGGSEAIRFALSFDAMQENGMMANTGADRYGVRLNTDFRPFERLSGGLDVTLNRSWDILPGNSGGSIFPLIHDTPPTKPVMTADGMYGLNLFGQNPIAYARETGDEQREFYQGTVIGRLNFDVIPGWATLQGLAAINYENQDWERFFTDSRYIPTWPAAGARWGPNRLEQRDAKDVQTTVRTMLDYGHSFGDGAHQWSGVVGYEQIANTSDEFRAWRQDFFNNDLRRLNVGNADTRGNSGFGSEWALRSVFGRMNYTLLDRYLFEVNARYDGSSRFAEGSRYGLFPSFSLGWRISEEPFFNLPGVEELKLRGSWGQLGNQDVPLYSYYSSISITQPYYFGGQVSDGAAATSLANEDLSWETTTVTDVGFDAVFMAGQLSLSGDLYRRRTDDILLNVPIPDMVGLSAPFVNAGVVENKGWELAVGWRSNVKSFNYGFDFNLSDNRNEVRDLYGTGPYISGESVVAVGAPIRSWYGFEAEGYFRDQAEIDAHAQPGGYTTRPGDLIFRDQDEDGVINEDDRVIIGDPNPRWVYGMNMTANWGNFDAGMLFQGVGKRDQYLALGFIQGPVWENYTSEWHTDYYDPELDNQDARHPTYYANENRNYYSTNSHWILDGSFLKLRNAQIGYSLPARWIGGIGAERVRVYVTGKNLWTHHNMGIDLDPEYLRTRADYYPQTQVFSIGTDISF